MICTIRVLLLVAAWSLYAPHTTPVDMGGPRAGKSVEDGADTVVWLAMLPDDGPNGGFFEDRQSIPW
jgi:hypothetical protein